MRYLQDYQYYIDRYDLGTIEECLDYYHAIKDGFVKARNTEFKKYSEEKFNQEVSKCVNLTINCIAGERYRNKAKAIQEWMDKDRQVQEKYDGSTPPVGILCKKCHASTRVTFKELLDSYEPDSRVMFMVACVKCNRRQAVYEDGSEWKYDPPKCPKCKSPLKTDLKIKGDISTFISLCTRCGYKDKDVHDHAKFKRETEEKEKRDKALLEKYRGDFCLSDKEGQEYIELTEKMKIYNEVYEEEKRKYESPVYQRASHLKKITIADLEKMLMEPLIKANYVKLSFDKPEIGQHVIVPFTVQDADASRKTYDSTSSLEKLIKGLVENTNWRLMSEGVRYRLGYISGRLRGYEQEEDMLTLAGKKKEPALSLIDQEKRMKYAGDNLVQLGRLMGELAGIEEARKRRLEKEPDGFFLNDGKEGYTCGICGDHMSGERTWWDLRGIRCPDCQRNLKAGVVPLEIFEDDYGYDVVIRSWSFRDDYGVHPSSVKKLRREGLLHGRDLKRADGTVYYTIYLVSENKEFLKKYPKKPKMEMTYVDSKGREKEL